MSVSIMSSFNAPKDFFKRSIFHSSLESVFPSSLEMTALFGDEMILVTFNLVQQVIFKVIHLLSVG